MTVALYNGKAQCYIFRQEDMPEAADNDRKQIIQEPRNWKVGDKK